MKKIVRRTLVGLGIALVVCAVLLAIHMIVNGVDLAGLLKSMHGTR